MSDGRSNQEKNSPRWSPPRSGSQERAGPRSPMTALSDDFYHTRFFSRSPALRPKASARPTPYSSRKNSSTLPRKKKTPFRFPRPSSPPRSQSVTSLPSGRKRTHVDVMSEIPVDVDENCPTALPCHLSGSGNGYSITHDTVCLIAPSILYPFFFSYIFIFWRCG